MILGLLPRKRGYTMNKHNHWVQKRHGRMRSLLGFLLAPYLRWKYNITVEPFLRQRGRQYLILFNHQTAMDPFFVSMAFKGPIYFMAPEDYFSGSFLSRLMQFCCGPIPISPESPDPKAVRACLQVAREGGTIGIAPEGESSFMGKTTGMNPTIAPLAKKLGLPVVLMKIEGGYGSKPRWSDCVRRGSMRAYVAEVIEPEELEKMTDGELMSKIRSTLWVNSTKIGGEFKSDHAAEYLERVMYVCPHCGLSSFHSEGSVVRCTNCNLQIEYLPNKQLQGVGFHFPFRFLADWYNYQNLYVSRLQLSSFDDLPIYMDQAQLYQVIPGKEKKLMERFSTIELYKDRLEINGIPFPLLEIQGAWVVGSNKLNLRYDDTLYQLRGDKRFNAVKYVNFVYRSRNIRDKIYADDQYLGV